MTGIWKEEIGGYNHKDSKRKTQTRKNTLRDKFRVLTNAKNRGISVPLKEEGEVEIIKEKEKIQKVIWISTWKIEILRYIKTEEKDGYLENIYSKSIRTAYYWSGKWYDDFSYEEININGGEVKKLTFLYKIEEELEEPLSIKKKNYYYWFSYGESSVTFAYGKPVLQYLQYWNDGKRRKIAQKIASSRDRQQLRTWIKKERWNEEIKSHSTSKSIAWEI